MRQLTQNLKDGKMELLEVPFPAVNKGYILVRNHYSVISAGTEGKTVKDARLGYIGKAMEREKEVKQVIESVKRNGLVQTYKMVMNKLDAPSPLGYSCAGEVIEVSEDINEFKIGDFAACGGIGAVHSEVVSIPKNLSVKVNREVDLKYAAFAAVGAIALQGIRQADLRLGENCAVIGLGLIGQLTIQLLHAAGVKAIGVDINGEQINKTIEINPGIIAIKRDRTDLENVVLNETNGYGSDAVIITAGTSSLDPIELAGILCRRKGKVIIVGSVPTGFSRKNYYQKELDLRMSCSYGPGRYDLNYEEKGIDYPYGYVRWTEKRNMQAFVDLISQGKINLEKIITHQYDFENAPAAYDLILNKSESFTGIILKYNTAKEISKTFISSSSLTNNRLKTISHQPSSIFHFPSIGFIGAGSFAQNFLLPAVKSFEGTKLISVATSRGNTARNIADKYGFEYAAGSADEIFNDERINTVFIAARHNLHAENVIKGLKAGKNIFVEKPLCLNESELEEIKNICFPSPSQLASLQLGEGRGEGTHFPTSIFHLPSLMVGFNRRFSPLVQKIKTIFPEDQPKAIHYRINSGTLPSDHWIQDKEIGGGRIIGEVCHFIDLAIFIAGAPIISLSANVLDSPNNLMDTLIINLSFANGSIASISYFSNGNKSFSKEYIEVYYSGQVMVINDFKEMKIFGKKEEKIKLRKQDKGHKEEVAQFLKSVKEGLPSPIQFEEIYLTTLATFKVIESIKTVKTIKINL